ncbi:MAG: AAA family ATPase [Gammaproteobacteria bacterium]|nr:AAA family ATPase [Gammaproteobacteria bacterium]
MPIKDDVAGAEEARKQLKQPAVVCNSCGKPMVVRTVRKAGYGRKAGDKFFGCSGFPECRTIYDWVDLQDIKRLTNPSIYQKAILAQTDGNMVVRALAGSGKTTTAVEYAIQASELRPQDKITLVAFNRNTVAELKERLPPNLDTRTYHSLGMRICHQNIDFYQIDENGVKVQSIIEQLIPIPNGAASAIDAAFEFRSEFRQLLNMARLNLTDPNDREAIIQVIDHYALDFVKEEEAIHKLGPAMRSCAVQTSLIDYNDMIFLPHWYGWRAKEPADLIIIDEAQDLSSASRDVVNRYLKPEGRLIAVGDPKQAINGFAGADVDSFDLTAMEYNANELPLPICYRCPTSHLKLAQVLVPEIEPASGAKEGSIVFLTSADLPATLQENDLVLCRLNAPLLILAMQCIMQGKYLNVKNLGVEKQLYTTIKKVLNADNEDDLEEFRSDLDKYINDKVIYFSNKGRFARAANLKDTHRCLSAIIDNSQVPLRTVHDLTRLLNRIFQDKDNAPEGRTVHRSKGSEAERVFILNGDLMPFGRATKDWQIQQEYNLLYVALTRSKSVLGFVNSTPRPIAHVLKQMITEQTIQVSTNVEILE